MARQAYRASETETLFLKAWALLDSGKNEAGFETLLQAARRGHLGAQVGVGYLYDIGKGTKRSQKTALAWYRRAVRRGDSSAACNIGTVYRARKSNARAMFWFRRAVALGNADALLEIARLEAESGNNRKDALRHLTQLLRHKDIAEVTREDAKALLAELRGNVAQMP